MPLDPSIAMSFRMPQIDSPFQQAGQLMTLRNQMMQQEQARAAMEETRRKAAQAQAYQTAVQALGPNPTQEQLVGVASRYGGPEKVMDIHQKSLDRREAAAARVQQVAEAAQQRQDAMDERKRQFDERQVDAQTRAKFEEWYKRESLNNQAMFRQSQLEMQRMGLGIQQQGLELRKDLAAQKNEKIMDEKEASANNVTANMDRLAQEANRLMKHPGLSKTTGLMSIVPLAGGLATVPGTAAANFKASLETLKSQAAFSVLQAMRDASKTGGALGQVSDFENRMLQANLAALDTAQSEAEFKIALKKIVDYTESAKDRIKKAAKSSPKSTVTPQQQGGGVKFLGFE